MFSTTSEMTKQRNVFVTSQFVALVTVATTGKQGANFCLYCFEVNCIFFIYLRCAYFNPQQVAIKLVFWKTKRLNRTEVNKCRRAGKVGPLSADRPSFDICVQFFSTLPSCVY